MLFFWKHQLGVNTTLFDLILIS